MVNWFFLWIWNDFGRGVVSKLSGFMVYGILTIDFTVFYGFFLDLDFQHKRVQVCQWKRYQTIFKGEFAK